MSLALAYLIAALSTYRLARIATKDSISLEWRRMLRRWAWTEEGTPPVTVARAEWRAYVYTLMTCPLCVGVWIAALVYVAWFNWSWSHPPLVILAVAGLQAFIEVKSDDDDG